MNVLLIGKNGQVGFELQRALAPLGPLVAIGRQQCDLGDEQAVRALVRAHRPDVVVNAAAYTAVDKAQGDVEHAYAINAGAPAAIAEEVARLGALLVHYSTDYVFDGSHAAPYREVDVPAPQNVYGASKLAGEQAIIASGARHLIFRSSWIVGAHGGNFAKTMLRLAEEKESLNVVADQIGAPTSAALIADVTAQILGQYARSDKTVFPFGLYHLSAEGETNWCSYAAHVVQSAKAAGRSLRLTPEKIHPISTAEYPLPASRPLNSRLNTAKLRNEFGLHLPSWTIGVNHVLQQIL